jgi:putative peptidoglycan lipid II flippase
MFALGRLKVAAVALTGSWLLVIAAEVILVELVPARLVVAALALGTTIGQTVVAIPLVMVTRRICGRAAVEGVGHATVSGLAAGAVSATVGLAVGLIAPAGGKLEAVGVAVVAAGCAVIAFGVVAYALDRGDLKNVVARLRQIARPRS